MKMVRFIDAEEVFDVPAEGVAHHYACYMHGDAGVCDEWFHAHDFCLNSKSQLVLWAKNHMKRSELMAAGMEYARPPIIIPPACAHTNCYVYDKH